MKVKDITLYFIHQNKNYHLATLHKSTPQYPIPYEMVSGFDENGKYGMFDAKEVDLIIKLPPTI